MYNKTDDQKDKRISFLSIFSSLSVLNQGKVADPINLEEVANKINNRLYINYPLIKPMFTSTKPSAYGSKPTREGENCECGKPRIYKEGIKNDKPWRGEFCQLKICPPIWLPNLAQRSEESLVDNLAEDKNKQLDNREYGIGQ